MNRKMLGSRCWKKTSSHPSELKWYTHLICIHRGSLCVCLSLSMCECVFVCPCERVHYYADCMSLCVCVFMCALFVFVVRLLSRLHQSMFLNYRQALRCVATAILPITIAVRFNTTTTPKPFNIRARIVLKYYHRVGITNSLFIIYNAPNPTFIILSVSLMYVPASCSLCLSLFHSLIVIIIICFFIWFVLPHVHSIIELTTAYKFNWLCCKYTIIKKLFQKIQTLIRKRWTCDLSEQLNRFAGITKYTMEEIKSIWQTVNVKLCLYPLVTTMELSFALMSPIFKWKNRHSSHTAQQLFYAFDVGVHRSERERECEMRECMRFVRVTLSHTFNFTV